MRREQRCRFHSSGRAASRSWTEAAVITTASSRPSASTAMCRFLPFTFFALSQPRLARGTVSAARTDWESITAAVGPGSRPAAARTRARSASCSRGQGAVVAPGGEVPVHRGPGREAVRQVPPGAPGPVQVQDRLDDLAQRPDPGPAAFLVVTHQGNTGPAPAHLSTPATAPTWHRPRDHGGHRVIYQTLTEPS